MSRDDSASPPTSKTTWLARTPMRMSSTSSRTRRPQLLQRPGRHVGLEAVGQRGLEARLLDAQAIGVGGDHPQLVAGRRHEDAGEDRARLVARGRAGDAWRSSRRTPAPGMVTIWSPPGSGSGGKSSARSVRMWNFAVPATTSTSCSAGRSSSETSPAGQLARDVEQQAGGEDDGARRARRRPRAARAGRPPCRWRAAARPSLGGDLHAGERLHGAARRRDAGDGLQLSEQLLRRGRQLHDDHL